MTDQKTTKYVRDWFARADEDLDITQLILDEKRPYNPACFHAQQAAEKYLKGFLAHHEKHVRKIHDLEALLQECIKIDQSFENLKDSARFLSRFYVESRYPDDYIEFTREDAEKGLEAALRIQEFVLEKIGLREGKGFGIVGILIVIAVVAVLGGGYWYWQTGIKTPPGISTETKGAIDTSALAPSEIEGWKTYRNEKYGFEVRYPKEYEMVDWKSAGPHQALSEIQLRPRGWPNINFEPLVGESPKEQRPQYPLTIWLYPEYASIDEVAGDAGFTKVGNEWINKIGLQGSQTEVNEILVNGLKGLSSSYPVGIWVEGRGRVGIEDVQIAFLLDTKDNYAVFFEMGPMISQEIFDKILSTFKFIPSTSLPDGQAGSGQVK